MTPCAPRAHSTHRFIKTIQPCSMMRVCAHLCRPAYLTPCLSQWQRIEQLLGAVPLDVLAAAALRVGANARALMYYERHVRAAEGGGLNPAALVSVQYGDEHVSFLQVACG